MGISGDYLLAKPSARCWLAMIHISPYVPGRSDDMSQMLTRCYVEINIVRDLDTLTDPVASGETISCIASDQRKRKQTDRISTFEANNKTAGTEWQRRRQNQRQVEPIRTSLPFETQTVRQLWRTRPRLSTTTEVLVYYTTEETVEQ